MPAFATVADIEAFESVPLADRNLPPNTYEAVKRSAERFPNKNALSFFLQATGDKYKNSVDFTYREYFAKITQTANLFAGLGVGPTDAVSYLLPNLPQTYFTMMGGEAAGISNPINPLLEPHVWAEIMNAAKAKVLVTITPFPNTDIWDKVVQMADDVPTLETILRIDMTQYLGFVPKVVVNLMRLGKDNKNVKAKILDFDQELAKYPSDKLTSGREIGPDEVAAYFHTGGTTGTPKLARHSHFNQVFDGWAAGQAIDGKEDNINFLGLPLFHNYGTVAVGMGAWVTGSSVIMATPSGFRGEGVLDNFWKILDHYNCNLISAVPTVYQVLLNLPLDGYDSSKVSIATCGAAPLPLEVARQFTAKTGIRILEGYGLTEGTSVNSVNPYGGEERIGSIGFRLPYQDMRIAILEDGKFERFAETDEVGGVILRGPNAFGGYNDDFHNLSAFVDSGDGKGKWVNTGDMGRQDADGYFWLTGRKKELIIRGGHNIDPKLIEDPMHEHPAVALAAAIGKPDPRVGELPIVYVELKPDATATEAELLEFAAANIGERAAIPKEIIIIDTIPQTAVGKIFKPTLVREQVKKVYEAELNKMDNVSSCDVVAEGDKKLGTVAYITVSCASGADSAAVEEEINKVLGQYSVHFKLDMG